MVIRCSCTWQWCKELREQNKVGCEKRFSLPRTEYITDPVEKIAAEARRASLEKKLRPGAKRAMSAKSTNGFLWWHLKPASFEWKTTFTRNAKRRRSNWVIKEIIVSNTKQTPPPDGREAIWNSHNWVKVGSDSTIVASASSFEQLKTPRKGRRIVNGALKAVSSDRVTLKQKKSAVEQLVKLTEDSQTEIESLKAQLEASVLALEASEANTETLKTLLLNAVDNNKNLRRKNFKLTKMLIHLGPPPPFILKKYRI